MEELARYYASLGGLDQPCQDGWNGNNLKEDDRERVVTFTGVVDLGTNLRDLLIKEDRAKASKYLQLSILLRPKITKNLNWEFYYLAQLFLCVDPRLTNESRS